MLVFKRVVVAVAIGLLALFLRLPGLGSFMTVDEENWMLRSAGFYHNLFREGDSGGTFMTTHPGATTMWLAGAGILLQEARLGFDIDASNLISFRTAATLPVSVAVSILIAIVTYFLMRLFGMRAGVVGGVLLAVEPYLVGMSQIVHLDMLLALFMLNAVLTFFLHQLRHPRGISFAATSGVFGGLAMATKLLPALWLFVFFAVVLLWPRMRGAPRAKFRDFVRSGGFIFGVAMLVFYIAWPALWLTADLGRSFEKDIPSVVQDAHVAVEESEEPTSPASFYARTLVGRTTPFVMILGAGSAVLIFLPLRRGGWSRPGETEGSQVRWLFLYALGFLLLITLAAKKADRYALPALVILPVLAGVSFPTLRSRSVKWGAVVIGILLVAQAWLWSPYTIAYNNPLFHFRPLPQQGWGEGLERAAAWLNDQPDAENLHVSSWYPGVMRTFFRGKTLSLSSRSDDRVGFVVLYRNMFGRGAGDAATTVVEEFENQKPAQVISIQGSPYVWIYDTRGLHYFPNHIGELFGEKTVGQLVPVAAGDFRAIEIGMVTFSSRGNTQDVILHIRESLDSVQDVRTVLVNAREIQDSSYHRFEFEPILGAAGKTYYVFLESPTSQPGDAVTVRFTNSDLRLGEMVKDGKIVPGRDVAWRIPQ